jgi:adenylate cyclase
MRLPSPANDGASPGAVPTRGLNQDLVSSLAMPSDEQDVQREEIEKAAQDGAERSRLRQAAGRFDTSPPLLVAARRMRQRLPGDERFGDPLSTAGAAPVQLVARGISSLSPERESLMQELGFAGLQVWQSISEAAGRGRGDQELALLFTDLVEFSSWALEVGDTATIGLLRDVGIAVESAVLAHSGRIVKRLGDGLMATFPTAQEAVDAALEAHDALEDVQADGYRPRMRAGIHWGRPRKLGGDYVGIDVNIAARVAGAAKADQVMVSEPALERIDLDRLETGRRRRLKADGAPRELHIVTISRR